MQWWIPESMLIDFTRVLVEQESELAVDQVRMMVRAQATTVGVPDSEVDDVVSRVMAQTFPSSADGSGAAGSVGVVDLD